MPNLWILSDLHREIKENRSLKLDQPEADILVAAGDILDGDVVGALEYVDQLRGSLEAVFVAGNHEHWGTSIEAVSELGRQAAKRLGIHYLDDSFAEVGGLTFAGGTLWHPIGNAAENERPNLLKIMTGAQPAFQLDREPFAPYEEPVHVQGPDIMDRRAKNSTIANRHKQTSAVLQSRFADVIVTHHPPTMANLASLPNVGLWVHGHIHQRITSRHGDTRIVCNPRGSYKLVFDFEPGLVLEAQKMGHWSTPGR
ncbi:metallophosphoesterase family protein [Bosea sp. RAC05]|uniref:metallophosphoesterase family protein n=1 Tax=Bosea sp. RAC05 TaxID=1842539 RepID=UPI00083E61A8|nr:metallophosphoesterase [Bosea sp. RAC05]AOG03336.1 calcineurin-like phosphoesterase family protein [Bosea sp. RAC05]